MRFRLYSAVLASCGLALSLHLSAHGQMATPSPIAINSGSNRGIALSPFTKGTIDPAALTVMAKHLNAIHADIWSNLQANGSIQLGDSAAAALPATLTISGSDNTQLLIQNSGKGLKSLTADGSSVTATFADGTSTSYPDLIGGLGFLQFQWLRGTDLSSRLLGLKDAGTVAVQGKDLRKIELLFSPKNAAVLAKNAADATVQADFYFDPTTFLLDRVATPIRLPGSINTLLQVTEYGSYQTASGTLVPFSIKQSIDGQPQWILTLTAASRPATLSASQF